MIDTEKIKNIVSQASLQNNCRMYDLYKHKDRLQIFIDKQNSESRIHIEDCENVFHSLNFLFQSEMPYILKTLRLEVSSPGLEKRLRERWHFEESIGKFCKITTDSSVKVKNKKTNKVFFTRVFSGIITSVLESDLHIEQEDRVLIAAFENITSAQLIFKPTKHQKNKLKK